MKIRYFIAYAARGAYDNALIWEDICEQHKGSYDDFIRTIIYLYFKEIPEPVPPPRSLASLLGPNAHLYLLNDLETDNSLRLDLNLDPASSTFALPIIEDIGQEHDDTPVPPPRSLTLLLGPHAHFYLSNDLDTDDFTSEINGVPFIADILSLQLSTNALEQVALQDNSLPLDLDTVASTLLSSTEEHKKVLVYDTDILPLGFPTDDSHYIALDIDATSNDLGVPTSAPDLLLCFAPLKLDGITFNEPEVPLMPPGLLLIPRAPLCTPSIDLDIHASAPELPPCSALSQLVSIPFDTLIPSTIDVLDSACDDLASKPTLAMKSNTPTICNTFNSQCDNLCYAAHPVLCATTQNAPSQSKF
jgi:hypothetical protein